MPLPGSNLPGSKWFILNEFRSSVLLVTMILAGATISGSFWLYFTIPSTYRPSLRRSLIIYVVLLIVLGYNLLPPSASIRRS